MTVVQVEPTKTVEELETENAALRRQLETARAMVRDLATAAPINNKALQRQNEFLQRWANPARMAELEQLVYKMLPNAKVIGMKGAMLVARRALALGLDPFVEGNLWAYVDDGVIRVAIGYLGHRERIEANGMKMIEPRKMTDEEREQHGLRDVDHGAVVEVWDPRAKEELDRLGIPYRPVLGIGVWRPDEKKTFVPVGRTGYWRAETRATNDAGKRAVRQTADTLRWLQGLEGASVSDDGETWAVMGDAAAEWTRDGRIKKAEEFLAELGLTDEIINQALGMDWRRTWMDVEDFKNFARLVAEQRNNEALEVEYTVRALQATTPTVMPVMMDQVLPATEPELPVIMPHDKPAEALKISPLPGAESPAPEAPMQTALFEQPSLCTFEGCDQPGQVTPVGFLCADHARQKADAEAAQS
jgi:hypothetical protein